MQAVDTQTKSLSVMLSATVQTAAVGSAVLLSILRFQTLDLRIQTPPLVAPRGIDHVKVVDVQRARGSGVTVVSSQPIFTAPSCIPSKVPAFTEPDSAPAIEISREGFIQGAGIPGGLVGPSSSNDTVTSPPPPPVTRVELVKAVEKPPLRIGGHVLEAKLLNRVIPVYPPLAKVTRTQGIVRLVGIIGRDGTVQKLEVVSGHPLLTKAALEAVRQWLYRPTLLNGEPTEVIAPIEVRFILSN